MPEYINILLTIYFLPESAKDVTDLNLLINKYQHINLIWD